VRFTSARRANGASRPRNSGLHERQGPPRAGGIPAPPRQFSTLGIIESVDAANWGPGLAQMGSLFWVPPQRQQRAGDDSGPQQRALAAWRRVRRGPCRRDEGTPSASLRRAVVGRRSSVVSRRRPAGGCAEPQTAVTSHHTGTPGRESPAVALPRAISPSGVRHLAIS
jgi:hypothetical protein